MFLKTITVKIFGNAVKNRAKFDETRNVHVLFCSFVTTCTKKPISEETEH